MSEPLLPCPLCGWECRTEVMHKTVYVYCPACSMFGPTSQTEAEAVDGWRRLARAVALLGAVERLEAEWLRLSTCNTIEGAVEPGVGITVDRWEYIGARMGRGSASAPTLAAALVALGEASHE